MKPKAKTNGSAESGSNNSSGSGSGAMQSRLASHATAFDSLLRLIPPRYYLPEDVVPGSTPYGGGLNPKYMKHTKKSSAKADAKLEIKRAKFDPDNHPSIAELQADLAARRKREKDEEDDDEDIEAAKKRVRMSMVNGGKKQAHAVNDSGNGDDEEEDGDEDDEDNWRSEDDEEEEDEMDIDIDIDTGDEDDDAEVGEEDDDEEGNDDEVVFSMDMDMDFSDINNGDDDDGDGDDDDDSAEQQGDGSSGSRSGGIEELKARLHKRLAELREQRKAPSNDTARGRQAMLEIRNKRKETRAKKKALKKQEQQQLQAKGGRDGLVVQQDKGSGAGGDVKFSKFRGLEITGEKVDPLNKPKTKKVKGPMTTKQALQKIGAQKEKLAKMRESNPEKAKKIEENATWRRMEQLAEGKKLKDDATLLKKTLKRETQRKKKSETAWTERKDTVKAGIEARQKKRQENIQQRIDAKLAKNKSKGKGGKGKSKAKPAAKGKGKPGGGGGGKKRAGFEGKR
ncbi:SURF6-domain-containing protein [Ramicandelaber brevisporus]|nr:SURF6-domain-containing protein [Ramicandelaber brevisporus]